MSTEAVATTTTTTSDRQSRSVTKQDHRRGRSRSPSAYFRKKGNGLMGIISGEKIRKGIKKSRSTTSLLSLSGKSSNKSIDNKKENETTDNSSSIANKPSEEEITESDSNSDKVETISDTVAKKLSETKIDQDGHVSTERDAEGSLRNPQDGVSTPKRSNSKDLLIDDDDKGTVQIILRSGVEVLSSGVETLSNRVRGLSNRVRTINIEKWTSQSKVFSSGVEVLSGKVKGVSNRVRAMNIEKLSSQSKLVGIGVALLLLLVMIIVAAMLSSATMPRSPGSTMKVGKIPRKCGIVDFFKRTDHCDGMSARFRGNGVLGMHQMEGIEEETLMNRIMAGKTSDMTNMISVLN